MGSIRSSIELQDNFTNILMNIINVVDRSVASMDQMQSVMNTSVNTSSIQGMRDQLSQTALAAQELEAAMQGIVNPAAAQQPDLNIPESVQVPVEAVIVQQPVIDTPDQVEVPVIPVVEQPEQIAVPEEINVDVSPVVTQQPDLNIPDTVLVDVQADSAMAEQRIADIQQQLQGVNRMQEVINNVAKNAFILPDETVQELNSVNREIRRMQAALDYIRDNPFGLDTSFADMQIQSITHSLDEAVERQQALSQKLGNIPEQIVNSHVEQDISTPQVDQPTPVEVPIVWQSDNLDVFTNSGAERFEMEVQSANNMLNTLNNTQAQIAARAALTNIFPPDMVTDMNNIQMRMQEIQTRIQSIENNPLNMGTDTANAELEQLRAQLSQAVQEQELMDRAVEDMDVQVANEAYLRLSQIIGGTERHIRDNVDEQGRFRREIEESTDSAADLKNMIASAVGAFVGMAGLNKAKSWIEDCTAAFNIQLNAETQLISVLANMLDADYVAQFEVDVGADTTAAVDEINAIQDSVNEVTVSVTAETKALTTAYDQITAKASEIQGRGVFGDEAMIAGAAELSTYFSDPEAVMAMMDTLSDYAMGMNALDGKGLAVDSGSMVGYATNLGKIMTGTYTAMSQKGFTFTDAQKAIIEGTATEAQIVEALGAEYLDMSADMRAAAAINSVIGEAWDGLYETMSNTPEGKIIQMNNTWGDMTEIVGKQLYPYVALFADAITENWGTIQTVLDSITIGLQYMLGVLSWLAEGAIGFAGVVADNWSWISPVIYGVAGALAVYYGWQMAVNAIELIGKVGHVAMAAAQMVHAAATGTLTAATAAEIAAQNGLNGAMYACPIVWIMVLIIALIALFYAAVAAVNKFAGTSVSATGIIAGVFAVLGTHIINTFIVPVWNILASLANFFGNFLNDPIAAVKVLFYDMCLTVIGYIQNLASAIETLINKIPGVSIDITSGLDGFYSQLEQAQQSVKDEAGWVEYVQKMDFVDYGAAWDAGYSFGEGIDESIAGFDPASLFGTTEIPSADDYASALTAGGIGSGIDDISGNTGAMADAMDITGEELKYLRDMAEQETINRFTTARITIEQTNHNSIKNGMDLDGIVSTLTDAVTEAVVSTAEGVHM